MTQRVKTEFGNIKSIVTVNTLLQTYTIYNCTPLFLLWPLNFFLYWHQLAFSGYLRASRIFCEYNCHCRLACALLHIDENTESVTSPRLPLQTVLITDLQPYAEYQLKVRAANYFNSVLLWSNFTSPITFTTSPSGRSLFKVVFLTNNVATYLRVFIRAA